MKIAFDHHSPFFLAHGGFQIQIQQTFAALKEINVDVDWLRWWDCSQTPEIVHYFGPCKKWYIDFAHTKNVRVLVTCLLTSWGSRSPWLNRMHGIAVRIGSKIQPRLAGRLDWDWPQSADIIICLTDFEKTLLCKILNVPQGKIHVVPNGVDEVFVTCPPVEREDWLMCSAVIHPRKRVLELARAATLARVPLRIFGQPYSETDPYFRAFLKVVEVSSGYVRWEGSISDRSLLSQKYASARGFVLPSTMESLALSALEAAATGCPLLLSELPWATTTFHKHASYLPPDCDTTTMARFIKSFHERPQTPTGFRAPTWREVARSLKVIYESFST